MFFIHCNGFFSVLLPKKVINLPTIVVDFIALRGYSDRFTFIFAIAITIIKV